MATALDTGITPITTTKIASLDVAGNCTVAEINALTTQTDVGLANVDNTADANKVVATAGALTASTTINGVPFDGSAPITVTANAGTLSGTTLKPTVTGSSLTEVGTIGTGVWQGSPIADAYISGATGWDTIVEDYVAADSVFGPTAGEDYAPDATNTKSVQLGGWTDMGEFLAPINLPYGASMIIHGVKTVGATITSFASTYVDMHGLIPDLSNAATSGYFAITITRFDNSGSPSYMLFIALES